VGPGPAAFLDGNPDDSSVLDRLRAAPNSLSNLTSAPEGKLHEAYRAVDPERIPGICPMGRALRRRHHAKSEGGVTYLFDDVTERPGPARRFDGLIRVQRETLDNLAESVAVFAAMAGPDSSSGLRQEWKLSSEALREQPHIETVEGCCKPLFDDAATWRTIREAITRIENRGRGAAEAGAQGRQRVGNCMTMPLPDGATMLTFQDITDTENVERALRERNERWRLPTR